MSQSSGKPHEVLYGILGVKSDVDPRAIKTAYRKISLETHPDRAKPDHASEATKVFVRVASAYHILSDPGRREEYDRTGEIPELSLDESKQRFDVLYKDEVALDKEADQLVERWALSSTINGSPSHSLGTDFDGFEQNLGKLFADASLMSSSSKRKAEMGESMENITAYCMRHFGKQNEERLRAWDGRDQLTPYIDGKYYDRDGNLVDRAEVSVELVYGVDQIRALHNAYAQDFRMIVEGHNVSELVKLLNQTDKPQYEQAFLRYQPVLKANVAAKIDWKEVQDIVQSLREVGQADKQFDRTWMPKRVRFDVFAQNVCFPPEWSRVIDEVLAPNLKKAPGIQSKFRTATSVEDEDSRQVKDPDIGDVAGPSGSKDKAPIPPINTSERDRPAAGSSSQDLGELKDAEDGIFVHDWEQKPFKVFGWRTFGRAEQLFLEQRTSQSTKLTILRVESALPYPKTLEMVKQNPNLDLNNRKLKPDDLRAHDLSDFEIIGFAQVAPGIAPPTGHARNTPCYFITECAGSINVVTRSEMSSAYGQRAIELIIDKIRQMYPKDLVKLKPMQKQLALEYVAMGDSDSETDSDSSDSPLPRHHGRGAMRQLGSSYRARTTRQPHFLLGQGRQDTQIEERRDRIGDALLCLEDLDPSERETVLQACKNMNNPEQTVIGRLERLKITNEQQGGEHLKEAIDELLSLAKEKQTAVSQRSRGR